MKNQLLPNQVYLRDERFNLTWIYDVDPEEWEFIKERGKEDENGDIVLSSPMIASLKKWKLKEVLDQNESQISNMEIPQLIIDLKKKEEIVLPDLSVCTNQQLAEFLTVFGGWRAYLEAQLSYVESKKEMLEMAFEEGLSKAMYGIRKRYEEEGIKRPIKEVIRGEAFSLYPQLRKVRAELIETTGLFIRLSGYRNQYKALYETVSRVVALRSQSREEV